jgi:hypothetical protein
MSHEAPVETEQVDPSDLRPGDVIVTTDGELTSPVVSVGPRFHPEGQVVTLQDGGTPEVFPPVTIVKRR